MAEAFICNAVRHPIGRLNGSLSAVRADDLAAIPIRALTQRNPKLDWAATDDVILGCANQAGEDNRNFARMAALLAGLPETVPGATVNRLCGSGLNAVGIAVQASRSGDAELIVVGDAGEHDPRAQCARQGRERLRARSENRGYDARLALRQSVMRGTYHVDTIPQTGKKVAAKWNAAEELERTGERHALAFICVGIGQGIGMILERV